MSFNYRSTPRMSFNWTHNCRIWGHRITWISSVFEHAAWTPMLRRCCTISRIYSPVSITHCNAKVDGQISTHQTVINSSPTNLMMDMMVKPLESPSQQTKPTVPWCFIAHLNVVQFFHTSCMIEITMVLICFNPLVNITITMERSTIFHGKIHYFYCHFQ